MPPSPARTSDARTARRRGAISALATGALIAVALTGCSHDSDSSSPATTTGGTSSSTATSAAPTSSTTVVTAVTTLPTTAAPTTAAPTSSVPVTVVKDECTADALDTTIISNGVAAGTQHYTLVFTNRSASPCVMQGYPGASFVDGGGQQIGNAAARSGTTVAPVPLPPGGQAHAALLFSQTGYQGSPECGPTAQATSLRVYAPDSTTAINLPWAAEVCTGDVPELKVEPVEPGPSEP
jgi:hypothetical protein